MSLGVALKTAASGLQAAQTSLRVVSDNISNVNTPGYVRKGVIQEPLVVNGVGMGVQIQGIKRITDQYLQSASLSASSDANRWSAVSQYLDNAQSLFGDPSSKTSFFNRLDTIFGAFATAADDPSSTLLRSQALSNIEDFLTEADRINGQIVSLGETMETRISAGVERANDLLGQINGLNTDISRAKLVGSDASGSENIQSQLVDELSTLTNLRVSTRANGGVDIRSVEGVLLAGDGAAKLTYNSTDSTPGYISAVPAGSSTNQPIQIVSGELRGLMDLRDHELPKLFDQLGEFVSRATEQLNAAHNAAAAYPPPASLTGRPTGLDQASAVAGFTGTATVALVNPTGVLQRRVDIDFTAGAMLINGAAGPAFTPATFSTVLATALGPGASVNFTGGALTINAPAGQGLAIDEGSSNKTGRGFSHYFGLNDLVKSDGLTNFETGLQPTSNHGFTAGGQITVRMSYPDGRPVRDITIAAPAAPLMSDLLSSLNSSATGVGLYGTFSLDADGHLAFAGAPPTNAELSIVSDNTQRGAGGPSISELFGLGTQVRAARAGRFDVNPLFNSDPTRMAMGKFDLTAVVGQPAVRPGDGLGALAISEAGDANRLFQSAGSLGRVSMSVSRYAAEFGGSIGRAAAAADTRRDSSEAVSREAGARRQSVEGVNLDEELVNLTTYQQAYNASARMIQATSELLDVLINLV